MNKPPIIVAHRGLHGAHPENSIAAFDQAIAAGFWVECDVHASRDGVPVIIHDETLERTTEAVGRVAEISAAELEAVRLKGSNETVPTLERALRGGGKWLIEIKPPGARELVRRVVDHLAGGDVEWVVQSFDEENVRELWSYHPKAAGALLVEDAQVLDRAARAQWPAVHVSHDLLTRDVRERLRRGGTAVGVWTVNETADIKRVLNLDVQVLITDEPWRVRYETDARDSGK